MAKRKTAKKFELDEFGFSSDLDVPEFNFEPPKVKDDRKPITKLKDAFVQGAKDQAKSPSAIRNLIRKAMPKGYGEAMDVTDQAGGAVRDLYDNAAQQIRPVIKDVQRVTKRIMPQVQKALPKSVAEKLKKWSDQVDTPSGDASKEQLREANISATLADIFRMQSQIGLERDKEAEVQNRFQDGISQSRHLDQIAQLDQMRVSLQQIANYHTRIDSAVARKSLELQYRHYFVAVDSLEEQKRMNALVTTNLEAIAKNTGLPDFVKLRTKERLSEVIRNKFIEDLDNSVFAKRRDFMRNLAKNIGTKINDKVRTGVENFKMGLSGVEMAMDMNEANKQMSEMMGEEPQTVGQMGAGLAGGLAAGSAMNWLGKKLRKVTHKSPTLVKTGNNLLYTAENLPQVATSFAKGDKLDGLPGMRLLKDTILQTTSTDNTIQSDTVGGMQNPDVFGRQTNKSITEIIPGYLARILREIHMHRTGEESAKLVTYDFTSNAFSDASAAGQKIFKNIVTQTNKANTKYDLEGIFKEIDPQGKLSAEERKALSKHLISGNMRNQEANPEYFKDRMSYSGEAAKHADKFTQLFSDYYSDDKLGEKKVRLANRYSRLGSSISLNRKTIQDFINTGNREQIEALGLLHKDSDQIDLDKLIEYHIDDGAQPAAPAATPAVRRLTKGKIQAARQPQPTPGRMHHAAMTPAATAAAVSQPAVPTQAPERSMFGAQENCCKDIVAAIQEAQKESQTGVKETNATLVRIEEQLKKGIPMLGADGKPFAEDFKASMDAFLAGLQERLGSMGHGIQGGAVGAKRWYEQNAGEFVGGIFSAGKRGVGHVFGAAKRLTNFGISTAGKAANFGVGVLRGAADLGMAGLKMGYNYTQRAKDVYVKGEDKPRLLARKMNGGNYRDARTGKIIEKFKDITGAVIDENGNEVISSDELDKLEVRDGLRVKALKITKGILGAGVDTAKSLLGMIPPIYRFGLKLLGKGYNVLVGHYPQDVFVKGKEDPVLLARTMKAGGYTSKVSGKPIRHPGDIDGAVLDSDGNVVLTSEEFAQGIYGKNGKLLRTGLSKLLGYGQKGLQMLNAATKRVMNVGKKALGFGKKIFGRIGRGIKAALGIPLGPDGNADTAAIGQAQMDLQSSMLERLTEIRNLIKERVPKPKKAARKGSYFDFMQKQEGEDEGEDDGQPKKKGRLRGLFGRLKGRLKLPGLGGAGSAAGSAAGAGEGLLGGGIGRMILPALGVAAAGLAGYFGMKALGGDAIGSKIGTSLADLTEDDPMKIMEQRDKEAAEKRKKLGGAKPPAASTPAAMAAAVTPAAKPAAAPAQDKAIDNIKADLKGAQQQVTDTGLSQKNPSDTVTVKSTAAAAATGFSLDAKPLDALTALRFKTYGLKNLEVDKVSAIRALEAEIAKGITVNGNVAQWTGSLEDTLDAVGGRFGTKPGVEFLNWLSYRFLPTFVNFCSAVAAQTGSNDALGALNTLKDDQKLAVAQAINGSRSALGGSVWDVSISPWGEEYAIGTDRSAIEGNLKTLQDAVKSKGQAVADPTAKAATGLDNKPKAKSLGDGQADATKEALGEKDKAPSFMDSLKDRVKELWDSTTAAAGKAASFVKDSATGIYNKAAEVGKSAAQAVGLTGPEIQHPGNGTGGSINDLPQPKGSGKWEYFQELFQAVGKMVGVDPNLMATMAAVESGFNPSVKASTSSATGLFQFINDTWKTMLKKYGAKYGIDPSTPATDARANALLGAEFLKENLDGLKSVVNRPLNAVDAYMAHFLGLGGARKFLRADPSASAPNTMPEAASANKSIFYDKGGSPRTLQDVYAEMRRRMEKQAKAFGIDFGGGGSEAAKTDAAKDAPGATDAKKSGDNPAQGSGQVVAKKDEAAGGQTYDAMGNPTGSAPSIPVSDQAPGATPTAAAAAKPAQQAANAPAAPKAADSAAAAAGAGFQPVQSLQAQQAYQKEANKEAFGPMTEALQQQLGVSKEQLEVLKGIREILGGGKLFAQAPAPASKGPETPTIPSPIRQAKNAPDAPVPMTKAVY